MTLADWDGGLFYLENGNISKSTDVRMDALRAGGS